MKVLLCEDTDWLLSEEAFLIYAPCMFHPIYEEYKTKMEDCLTDYSVKVFVIVFCKSEFPVCGCFFCKCQHAMHQVAIVVAQVIVDFFYKIFLGKVTVIAEI